MPQETVRELYCYFSFVLVFVFVFLIRILKTKEQQTDLKLVYIMWFCVRVSVSVILLFVHFFVVKCQNLEAIDLEDCNLSVCVCYFLIVVVVCRQLPMVWHYADII